MAHRSLSRRAVLSGTTTLAAAGVAAAGIASVGTGPAAAASLDDRFVADDVRVERNDGHLDAVTVAPELEVSWRDYGDGVERIAITVAAAIEDEPGFDVLYETSVVADDERDAWTADEEITLDGDGSESVSGAVDLSLPRRDLTAVGDDVTAASFGTGLASGESATTSVELTLRVDIEGAQGESESAFETVAFDVTVHNPDGEASASGRIHAAAE